MIRDISVYLNGKLFEWFAALNMTAIGLTVLVWPTTLSVSAFRYLFLRPELLGLLCFLVGLSRLVALIVNGRSWIYGPRVRAWAALFSGIVWLQLWISLAQYALSDTGIPSIGLSNWLLLFLAELIVTYRAATDVRNS